MLDIANLTVDFHVHRRDVRAVDGVSLSIAPGEKYALVGESGSGKSVTAFSVLRLNDADRVRYGGSIKFNDNNVLQMSQSELLGLRGRDIGMIFQEPMTALNPVFTVGSQIMEPLMQHEGLTRQAARQRAIELLERTGIREPASRADAYPHMLSGGQRQRAMIAIALACKPRLLIADEPTTALDVTIQAQIMDLLGELQRDLGMAVLLITHDLNLVRRFADRIGVMRQGQLVESGGVAEVYAAPRHEYTQMLLNAQPGRLAQPVTAGTAVVEGHGVHVSFPRQRSWFRRRPPDFVAVDTVDFRVGAGETLGVVGESGSGKTTLALALLRLLDCQGKVVFQGTDLTALQSRALRPLRRKLQVVFQDPFSSLNPRFTVGELVGEGLRVHEPELDAVARTTRVVDMLREVGLTDDILWRYPHEFSGGQRQRLAIARAMVLRPQLVVLDEPTSALDVSIQKQVLELLTDLQARYGVSYVLISHDLRVIRAMAHRVLVMQHGKVVEAGDVESLFSAPQQEYTRRLLTAALEI